MIRFESGSEPKSGLFDELSSLIDSHQIEAAVRAERNQDYLYVVDDVVSDPELGEIGCDMLLIAKDDLSHLNEGFRETSVEVLIPQTENLEPDHYYLRMSLPPTGQRAALLRVDTSGVRQLTEGYTGILAESINDPEAPVTENRYRLSSLLITIGWPSYPQPIKDKNRGEGTWIA